MCLESWSEEQKRSKSSFLSWNLACPQARPFTNALWLFDVVKEGFLRILVIIINRNNTIRWKKVRKLGKRIISRGGRTGYLEARRLTKGRLPSNVLVDDYLVSIADRWKTIRNSFPLWAREILVYPEIRGKFEKGKDVVDSKKDERRRKWILPASYVPEEAIGREKVGLFVDPEDVREEGGNVIVHPKSIVVLSNFSQPPVESGKVDEVTRIPLVVNSDLMGRKTKDTIYGFPRRTRFSCLSDEERSWFRKGEVRELYRKIGVGVRPLVRYPTSHRHPLPVRADVEHGRHFGVTYVDVDVDFLTMDPNFLKLVGNATIAEVIEKIAKERGGVAKIYSEELGAHEIVVVMVDKVLMVHSDSEKVSKADFSNFEDPASVKEVAIRACHEARYDTRSLRIVSHIPKF